MGLGGIVLLIGTAGLNPWLTVLIVTGLATYTRHAQLTDAFAPLLQLPVLLFLALLLGVEVVVGKVPRFRDLTEVVNLFGAAAAGAWLCLSVPSPLMGWQGALFGAFGAVSVRLLRQWGAHWTDRLLRPHGYIAAVIASNVAAGALSAFAHAVK